MAKGRFFSAVFGRVRAYYQRHRGTASAPFLVALGTLKGIVACHLLWEHGISFGSAAGSSMLPTFSVYGDYILVSKYYRRGRDVKVGDVIFYDIPIFRRAQGVKRIMGMPGDYVLHGDPDTGSQVMIQVCFLSPSGPIPLALLPLPLPLPSLSITKPGLESALLNRTYYPTTSDLHLLPSSAPKQVPQGHCWITGDNLESSRDSRTFGPLPLALVRGKVLAKIWPLSEARWIRNGFEEFEEAERRAAGDGGGVGGGRVNYRLDDDNDASRDDSPKAG